MIIMYDLKDNYITEFSNDVKCAEWFNTTPASIRSHLCRKNKGLIDKKRDIKNKKWYRLFSERQMSIYDVLDEVEMPVIKKASYKEMEINRIINEKYAQIGQITEEIRKLNIELEKIKKEGDLYVND